MLDEWRAMCLAYASKQADFYSGARKILRTRRVTFENIQPDLKMADCGFTKSKSTMLRKLYLHEESRNVAVKLWEGRLARAKYGSVGFHCFNHAVKGGTLETKRAKRASVMGPCLQSVSITLVDKRTTAIDVFYRTTELFKKFPADLVFIRDELLAPFDFSTAPIASINFHFANVTVHPMYFVTVIPHIEDPLQAMAAIKSRDPYFHDWLVKWTARYICEEHHRGIAKFSQALRTQKDALERIPPQMLPDIADYLRANHPGHRNSYQEDEDSGD